MRTTLMVIACSVAAACAPVGNPNSGDDDDVGPDAGTGSDDVGGPCTTMKELSMNLAIASDSGFNNLPKSCWKLNGKLTISSSGVTSLAKLGDLRQVTDLEINNTGLTTLDAPTAIEVSGEILVHYNEKLTDLSKLSPVGTLDSITVEHNAALTSLGGLSKATVVAGATTIQDNGKLTTIDLGAAERLEGGVYIHDNSALTSIDVHKLQSTGDLTIANNAALTTLTTSTLLNQVHGTLTVDNNDQLTSLGTFGSAVNFGLNVIISGNAKLTDVGQIAHANIVLGAVSITSNSSLDTTRAHDVGCCVTTNAYGASNNKGQCQGNHWCQNQHNCYR